MVSAQTEDLESHAFNKLKAKRLDWIAGNLVGKASVGFQSESNELLVLNARGGRHVLGHWAKARSCASTRSFDRTRVLNQLRLFALSFINAAKEKFARSYTWQLGGFGLG